MVQRLAEAGLRPSHAPGLLRAYLSGRGADAIRALRLPKGVAERIVAEWLEADPVAVVADRQVSADGTTKLLLRLRDGKTIEAVLMPDFREDRAAGCVSSQVGCAMACDFCATAQGGFSRHLTPGEIVAQFVALRAEARAVGRELKTLVFMGMGEPMMNLPAVVDALRRIADPRLGGLGWRQVTVSTVGIVAGIDALAREDLGVQLAVSLHAPEDETRTRILPTGRKHTVAEVLAAADRFQAHTGRPYVVQYCLLAGVNDSPDQARLLAALMNGRRAHVNLIAYNPTGAGLSGYPYEATSPEAAEAFLAILRDARVVSHLRRPRGRDIDAACGQLRRKREEGRS
jgi:23S rRNA (adenine2503-C2)-methyltransferase